jgi:4'-phosphopantetheinyl transferase
LTVYWAPDEAVQAALNRLPQDEKAKVLRFHFTSDAKMALASCLLKRKAITQICEVPWHEANVTLDHNKKPYFVPGGENTGKTIALNVSHHGGLVAVAACPGSATKLGIDIVSMSQANITTVARQGFETWVRTFEAVFSDRELNDIVNFVPPESSDPQAEIATKLRHFYLHWAMKEAYVKMTGEGLVARWVKDLEFLNVRTPKHANELNLESEYGEAICDVEIYLYSKRVYDVKLEVQAFRDGFLVVAASDRSINFLPYTFLGFEEISPT